MKNFATYLYSLPTSPLIEAVKALYEPIGTLRKPTPEELSEFVSMASETEHTMRGDWESNREAIVNEDKEFIEQVSNGTFKAVTDGNGIVIYGPYDGRMYVYLLFVRPECRRTGTAQRLMEYVKSQAKGMPVALSVNNHNDAARALYKKLGMADSKTFGYDGYDIIEMQSPVMEAIKNLYENTHTDRAVRVNKTLDSFVNALNYGIEREFHEKLDKKIRRALLIHSCKFSMSEDELKSMADDIRKNTSVSISKLRLDCAGLSCIVDFSTVDEYAMAAYYPRVGAVYIYVRNCLDNMEYDVWEDENGELESLYDDVDLISTECEKNNQITVNSQTIDKIIKTLQCMFSSNWFKNVIRHELTHHDQDRSGDPLNHDQYMIEKEPSVDRSDRSFLSKYHDIFPWEIDANVQQNISDMIHDIPSSSVTDLAKKYYNQAMYRVKELGKDTPERRKQCWQTAVSLARAAQYTTKEHGAVPNEWTGHNEEEQQAMSKLINHLGDYPV